MVIFRDIFGLTPFFIQVIVALDVSTACGVTTSVKCLASAMLHYQLLINSVML